MFYGCLGHKNIHKEQKNIFEKFLFLGKIFYFLANFFTYYIKNKNKWLNLKFPQIFPILGISQKGKKFPRTDPEFPQNGEISPNLVALKVW